MNSLRRRKTDRKAIRTLRTRSGIGSPALPRLEHEHQCSDSPRTSGVGVSTDSSWRGYRCAAGKVFAEVESRPSLDGSHCGEAWCCVSGKRIGVPSIEYHEIRVKIAQNAMDKQPGRLLPRVSCNI